MANSLLVYSIGGAGAAIADALTRYFKISGGGGTNLSQATEANAETPIRDGGVFSNLFVRLIQNDIASATSVVFTLRLSRAATAVTVSFGTSQTGVVEDTTHTATAANTDEVDMQMVTTSVSGSHTATVGVFGIQFAPTTSTDCLTLLVASGAASAAGDWNFSTASTVYYFIPGQGLQNTAPAEGNSKYRIRDSFTASDLFTNVITNGRTTDTVIRTRKNGADGGQSVTYTSGQTGTKEDTSGTDSLAAGDDFGGSVTTSTGTGTINFIALSCSLISTTSAFVLFSGAIAGTSVAFNVTTYFSVSGTLSATTTEANTQVYPRFAFTAKELGAYVSANTIATSATVVRLRNNTADGNQSVSFAAAQTGLLNDSSNTDSIPSGSTGPIDYQVVTPNTSGSITFNWISVLGSTVTVPTWFSRLSDAPNYSAYPQIVQY